MEELSASFEFETVKREGGRRRRRRFERVMLSGALGVARGGLDCSVAAGLVAHPANGAYLRQQETRTCECAELPDGERGLVSE